MEWFRMVQSGFSVSASAAECLVAVAPPIAQHFSYIWNYETNFDKLETELRKLQDRRDCVKRWVEEERRNGKQSEPLVDNWLDRVHTIIAEVSVVIEENERADMICFMGLCPNPKKRYQHSRKAVKQAKAIVGLYADGNFQTVSFPTVPKETWIPSHKGYEAFESRMSTLKDILNALSNPDVNVIGIYGTGGIGKTMLAREIAGQAEDKKLFNVVAFAEVAVKPDIKEIQKAIADKLGLTFTSEESVSGRARRLQQRLKQEEKVLLVLDNIWERLKLEEVGIPFGNEHKGCKLLLTTRSLEELSKMDSQSNFQISSINEGEAWSLFKKKAGPNIENNDHLQALAKNVSEACRGLPIAINSVAVALKNKEEFEWKDALTKLTTPSPSNFEGVAAETYSSIEISYNQLKEEELKSSFLLCCMMKYTMLEDLLAYGMGLGVFENVEAMENARNRVNTLVRKLKDSSLLLDINNYTFSLHDVVRGVGTSIASRDRHMFTVTKNYIPRELVDKDVLKNCFGIALHNIDELPNKFECPELKFFYMRNTAEDYCQVPDDFFAGMPKLKVLHLAGLELYSVPNSFRLLVNLRTLYIEYCKLSDIDFIGEIKQLEILRICYFYDSGLKMLSKKMCNLSMLRRLDLNDCYGLTNIPPNVLSTFTRLEELYLPADIYGISKIEWEVEGINILDELKHLTHLTALKISIPDANVLPKGGLLSKKLERYTIIIGNCNWYVFSGQTSRIVKLNLETSSCFDDVQKFFSLLDREGFPELEHLHLENSPCFRTVVDCLDSESCHHFLFLESLSLDSVLNLERIHNHQLGAESFRRLRTITVECCHKLKNILSFSTYRTLPLLQQVNVFSSDDMEEIFAIEREEEINNNEGVDQIEFKQLRCLTLEYLPKLTSFCSINGNKDMLDTPTPLFNQKVAFPSLEEIKIVKMDDLEMIWPNQLCKDSFCNLKSLKIRKCNKLLTIFQSNMLERIMRLESLTICDCDLVEEIFDLQGVDFEESPAAKETLLQELNIVGLPKLKQIWNKDQREMFSFQKLNRVKVHHCMSMRYLFPISIAKSLSELEQLSVDNCGVEEIVADDQGEANVAVTFVFPQMTSLEINYLPQLKTFYRGIHTLQWPNLKRLGMSHCDKVELFASELFNFQENNEGQHDESSVLPLFMVEKDTFPTLEEIKISESNNLKIVWNKRAKESFCNLKSMEVINCASVEEIFNFQKVSFEEPYPRAVTHHQLQKLYIKGLPKLKQIWNKDPQVELSIKSLRQVEVSDCQSLKVIFPASIARSLSQLVKLDVENCGLVEEIVAMEGEAKAIARFVFPKVTSIRLNKLPQLRTFYPGVHSSKWLFLKELEVISCDKIELLASQLSSFQENIEESHLDISAQPLFLVEKDSFPNLEKLKLRGETIKILQSQFSEQLFCNLKFLEVYNDKSVVFPLCILQRLRHMQDLRLQYCSYEEIFSYEEDETHVVIDSKLDMVLQKLESLMIYYCVNLIQVVPSSASFQNLTFFRVWSCNGLKNLMTSSTAKSLVQLREMEIKYCKSMIEVVAKEGDVTRDQINFSKLRTLTLDDLPSLSCFCSENYSIEFPSLEQLTLKGCPEMKYFSLGDVTMPLLSEFTLEGDLNTTIQWIHDSRVSDPYNWKEEDFLDLEDKDSCNSEDEDY